MNEKATEIQTTSCEKKRQGKEQTPDHKFKLIISELRVEALRQRGRRLGAGIQGMPENAGCRQCSSPEKKGLCCRNAHGTACAAVRGAVCSQTHTARNGRQCKAHVCCINGCHPLPPGLHPHLYTDLFVAWRWGRVRRQARRANGRQLHTRVHIMLAGSISL